MRVRTALTWMGYTLLVLILGTALYALAAHITATELSRQARTQQTALETNQPFWQWRLRKPADVIAGRAFGAAQIDSDNDALRAISDDGTPFQLGLPIAWAVDLAHWPILQLQLHTDAAGALGLIWQGPAPAPACVAAAGTSLSSDTRLLRIDLRDLQWHTADGASCPSPNVATMLRLDVRIPAHASIYLQHVALLATQPMPQGLVIELPAGNTHDALRRAVQQADSAASPLFMLPPGLSAQSMLAWRDQLRLRWPGALIVPHGYQADSVAVSSERWLDGLLCAFYLLALLALLIRRGETRLRAWLHIAAYLFGPLWLIVELHWAQHAAPAPTIACIAAMLFAVATNWRQLPQLWRGSLHLRDWLWPLAMLAVTLILIACNRHGWHSITFTHAVSYLAWALLQQWLMLAVVLRRLEQVLPGKALAVIFTASAFALLHTPNGLLMEFCFAAELWWAWCYLRFDRLVPIAVAHAVCALLVEASLAGGVLRSLEVSGRFFV